MTKWYLKTEQGRLNELHHRRSEKSKARFARYRKTEKRRISNRLYHASAKGKARWKKWAQSEKGRISKQRRDQRLQPFGSLYLHLRQREGGL